MVWRQQAARPGGSAAGRRHQRVGRHRPRAGAALGRLPQGLPAVPAQQDRGEPPGGSQAVAGGHAGRGPVAESACDSDSCFASWPIQPIVGHSAVCSILGIGNRAREALRLLQAASITTLTAGPVCRRAACAAVRGVGEEPARSSGRQVEAPAGGRPNRRSCAATSVWRRTGLCHQCSGKEDRNGLVQSD
jgi:hypothetical protein